MKLIAVLDVGKTHTRLRVIDPELGREVWRSQRDSHSVEAAVCRQLDVTSIEAWLWDSLRAAPRRSEIRSIVPIAHGAAAVLIGAGGEVLAAPDYEDPRFDAVNEEYARERDAFDATCSPSLPLGLNLGRQLFYLETRAPELFARVRSILPYAQFWAWRLCGVMASEVTTLGCHSDLWRPAERRFSELARRRDWAQRFAPLRQANEALGPVRADVALSTGLDAGCQVHCGIHDSNASYLRHLLPRRDERFAVVSSGTWTVVMASRADLSRLQERRDMLANVDVFGSAVATARFMGGREYEAIARGGGRTRGGAAPRADEAAASGEVAAAQGRVEPTDAHLQAVLSKGAMALPSFATSGPFNRRQSELIEAEALNASERAALATLYVALMTDYALDLLGVDTGDVIVDGPLAGNLLFGQLLAALRTGNRVYRDAGQDVGPAVAFLAGIVGTRAHPLTPVSASAVEGLQPYRRAWRERAERRKP